MQFEKHRYNTETLAFVLIVLTFSCPLFAAHNRRMTKREIRKEEIVADYFYRDGATGQKGIVTLGGSEGAEAALKFMKEHCLTDKLPPSIPSETKTNPPK